MIPFFRWMGLVLLIWGIPASLFIAGLGVYQNLSVQRHLNIQYQQVESRLLEFSQLCDFSNFFELRCLDLFSRLASAPSVAARGSEAHAFEDRFPKGLVKVYLFDRDGALEHPKNHPAADAAQRFFQLAVRPWHQPLMIDTKLSEQLQRFLANPEGTLRILHGRPGRMLAIGTPEASFAWYQFLPQQKSRPFAGVLILFNTRFLPDGFLLRHFAAELSDDIVQIGFRSNKGSLSIPWLLDSNSFHKLMQRFDLIPEDRFSTHELIGCIQRFDSSTLIVGVTRRMTPACFFFSVVLFAYALISFCLLTLSYRVLVLQQELRLSLFHKTFLFMMLGLGFPLILSGMLTWAFLEDKQDTLRQDLRDEAIQELRQIDQGFDLFLTRRLQTYRRLSRWLTHHSDKPDLLLSTLTGIYRQNDIDALYLVSSDSQHLGFFRGLPIEIRRILAEPPELRDRMFESAVERQYMPTNDELIAIAEGAYYASKANDYEQMLLRLISHAAKTAINYYNETHGFDTGPESSLQQLAMDGMMNDEGRQYVEAVRSQLSGLIPMSSENDFGLNYMEVIPGKDGRGAYFLIIFHNLNALEHDYLRSLYRRPGRLAEVQAVSLYPTARNFPRYDAYRRFHDLLKRIRRMRANVLFHRDQSNHGASEQAFLRCSHLKHYTLIKSIPEDLVSIRLRGPRLQTFGFMLGTLLFGALLFHIFLQRLLVPVGDITSGIEAMASRHYDFRVPVRTRDELGKLCQALNHALGHLGQMEVASAIQSALLPSVPYQSGAIFITGRNQMTQAVGGDYFDIIPLAENRCAVILGDVSGHGVSAAIVAAMAKAGFSLLCPRFPERPQIVLEKLNLHFLKILDRTKMMTCLLGVVDGNTKKLIFSNAGQCYPLLIDRRGNTCFYSFASMPLGIRSKATFVSQELDLTDTEVLFYSDGLIEAQTGEGQIVGQDGFAQAACQAFPGSAAGFLDRLFAIVRAMTKPNPWSDDASAVLISTRDAESKNHLLDSSE